MSTGISANRLEILQIADAVAREKSIEKDIVTEISRVSMLGAPGKLTWSQTPDGLVVTPPAEKPCEHAFVFKIERQHPFSG